MNNKNQLVFLISPPNSGSTLLQQFLKNNKEFATFPESWLLLHGFSQFKDASDIKTIYRHDLAKDHVLRFLDNINKSYENVLVDIGSVYKEYYLKTLEEGQSIILDKTPRYYLIINELKIAFPDAKFIFLVRNPINTFASTLNRYWDSLNDKLLYLKSDFFISYVELSKHLTNDKSDILIRYEDLCNDTTNQIKKICQFLCVEFNEQMITYKFQEKEDLDNWGDKSGNIEKNNKAFKVTYGVDFKYITNSNIFYSVYQYANHLDSKLLASIGYNKDNLIKELKTNKFHWLCQFKNKKKSIFYKIKSCQI